jgi:hypothetical protein
MSIALLLPVVYGIVLLVVVALTTVYAARAHDIDHVILLARKLDTSDLEMLLDAGAEWSLRQCLTIRSFQAAQEDRMRLVREYLRRVSHNVELIQLWVTQERQLLEGKNREEYTERDSLVVEALQLAIELRLYSLAANLRIRFWMALRAYRWPRRLIPRVPDLRVQCGVNVIEKYRRLIELAVTLSGRYGKTYHDRLLEAL